MCTKQLEFCGQQIKRVQIILCTTHDSARDDGFYRSQALYGDVFKIPKR